MNSQILNIILPRLTFTIDVIHDIDTEDNSKSWEREESPGDVHAITVPSPNTPRFTVIKLIFSA